jgi:hypothetical protein
MTHDDTQPDQSVSGSQMGVTSPLSKVFEQMKVGSLGLAALDGMKVQQDAITKMMAPLSGLNSPVLKMFEDMKVSPAFGAVSALQKVLDDQRKVFEPLAGITSPFAKMAEQMKVGSLGLAALDGMKVQQDAITKMMAPLSGLNSPVLKMFEDMKVSPAFRALADALDARRVLEEVRYLEELLADSPDEEHRPRGLRGMSDEDLERLGGRLLQLPATTLALVLTVTLVSHPMLFAYVSAALLSWQAKEKALAALRRI